MTYKFTYLNVRLKKEAFVRLSSYLIEVVLSERVVLVNSLSGAIDEVTLSTYKALKSWQLDKTQQDYLRKRGHITEITEEQEKDFAFKLWKSLDTKYRENVSVVICPSMDCNFRCSYCFERLLQNRIDNGSIPVEHLNLSHKQVDAIFTSFSEIQKLHKKIRPEITLYGGESLLPQNYEVIKYITKRASDMNFSIFAVTNGYELSTFHDLLGKNGIKSIQVSLDGLAEHHNKNRPAIDGQPTFEKILTELEAVLDIDELQVVIRMNYDSSNVSTVPQLSKYLTERGILDNEKVTFYANLISMNHEHKGKDYKALKQAKNLSLPTQFDLDGHTAGLRGRFESAIKANKPLPQVPIFCAANSSMYVFSPDGGIYACWEGLYQEHSLIGQYEPKLTWNDSKLKRWHMERKLPNVPQCQNCSHLFFCGSGCTIQGFYKTAKWNAPHCDNFKNKFEVMIESLFSDKRE